MRYALLLLAVAALAIWGNWPRTATVSRVLDGDTLVLSDGRTVRIYGIDAPEAGQAHGGEAVAALGPLAGYPVRVRPTELDRYGRTVAKVYYGGEDIGLLLLRAGHAWHYRQYDQTPAYAEAEREARDARRGLWADPAPQPPWEWRATSR